MVNIFTIGIKLSKDPTKITADAAPSTLNALEYQFIASVKLIGLLSTVADEIMKSGIPASPNTIQRTPKNLVNPSNSPKITNTIIIPDNLLKVFMALPNALLVFGLIPLAES